MERKTTGSLTLMAVGDLHPCGIDPHGHFRHCREVLRQADIAFGQFEGAVSPGNPAEVYSPQPRICCAGTKMGPALADAGFHILSLASNHAMDGGFRGLRDTMGLLDRNGIRTVGAGVTLEEAREPVVLERNGRRVAFLSSCSVMPVGYEAAPDRPGVAPLRATTSYEQVDYQPGTPPLIRTSCHPDDLQAVTDSVRAVRSRADVVVVSFHFGVHLVPEYITAYEEEATHAVIDAGADLVLGHHPHILKGIDVYKGKVIFYSLGNFAMDIGGCRKPSMHWFYDVLVRRVLIKGYPWYFRNTPDPEEGNRLTNPDIHKTMIAQATIGAGGVGRVSFLPAIILSGNNPMVLTRQDPRAQEVFDYVQRISLSQGLKATLAWDGDEVVVSGS